MPTSARRDGMVVDDIFAGYTWGQDILQGVSFAVSPGEIATIVGPNGAGKSTIIKAMMGLVKVRKGAVSLDGDNVTRHDPRARVTAGLAICAQGRNNFPELTVEDNLYLAASAISRHGAVARVKASLENFEVLAVKADDLAGSLSGGQQQLLELAMALISSPRFLMADEPSLGLSPANATIIFDRLRSIADDGVSVLLVEQNARQALAFSDKGIVIAGGRVVYEGAASSLLEGDRLRSLILS